jgi:hypothetical protein
MDVGASPALAGLRAGGAILLIGALVLLVKGFSSPSNVRMGRISTAVRRFGALAISGPWRPSLTAR